jgi:hypothetical protein
MTFYYLRKLLQLVMVLFLLLAATGCGEAPPQKQLVEVTPLSGPAPLPSVMIATDVPAPATPKPQGEALKPTTAPLSQDETVKFQELEALLEYDGPLSKSHTPLFVHPAGESEWLVVTASGFTSVLSYVQVKGTLETKIITLVDGFATELEKITVTLKPGEFLIYYKCFDSNEEKCESFVMTELERAGLTIKE